MVDAFVEPETSPRLTITPALQDFGDVVEGESSMAANFTVENVGDGESAPLSATLGGTGAGAFAFTANDCAGEALAPGATCTISIEFAPEATGRAMATVDVTDGDVRTSATLQGRGISDGALAIDPSPHNFGRAVVGTPTAAQTFTVTNNGGADTGTLMASITGTDPMQFRIVDDGCAGMTLAPAATCTIDVEYNPAIDGSHSANLSVTASPGDTVNAALLGMASAPPGLRVSPLSVGFGSAPTGTVSSAQTITVTNTGGMPTGALTNTLGGANASEFSITGSTCDGLTLAGGASCTVNVVWTAGAAGDKVATLTVGDGTLSGVSNLTATAVTPGTILVEPASQNFGDSPLGIGTGGTTFTARNPGGTDTGILTVAIAGTNPGDFRIVSDGCSATTLGPSASCTVAVEFLPTAVGNRSATLRVAGTPGGTGTADLRGNGVSPAQIEVTPTAHNFGSIATAASGTNRDFTVRNLGSSPTGVPMVELTGVNSVHFRIVANTCTAAIAGGASCTVTVNYFPTALGSHTAVLNVTGAPGGSDTADLSGTGITPAALEFTGGASIDFGLPGTAETDTSMAATITVRNAGQETTGTLATTLTGGDFVIMTDNCVGRTLATLTSCTILVQFRPANGSIGARTGSVQIVGTPGGTLTSALAGTGRRDIEATGSPAINPTNIGATSAVVWTFRNNTSRSIVFTATPATFAGPDGGQFTADYAMSTCDGATVASGATCDIRIVFAPTGTGGTSRTATLTLAGTGTGGIANSELFNLTGQANGPLIITEVTFGTAVASGSTPGAPTACSGAATTSIAGAVNFDQGTAGAPSQAVGLVRDARICYLASGTAIMGAVRTAGAFTGDLRIVGDTCSGANLTAGARCQVDVRFYPQTAGTPNTGTVTLTYGASPTPGISTVANTVSGTGATGAGISITPAAGSSLNFGTVTATVPSTAQVYTVANTGTLSTGAFSVAFLAPTSGTDGGAQFAFTNTSAANDCSQAIFAGGLAPMGMANSTCQLTVVWTPAVNNTLGTNYGRRIRVRRTGPIDVFADLVGQTGRYLTITTPATKTIDFGTVNIGVATAAQSFTIAYTGTGTSPPISCNGATGEFADYAVTNGCPVGGLASGGTCTCSLVLTATSTGSRAATFLVSAGGNPAQQDTGSTTATANNPPNLTVSPASANFGSVPLGSNSSDVSFTVRNGGTIPSPAPVTTVLGGAAPVHFEIRPGSTCGAVLAPGATCTFSVRFNPMGATAATFNADITVDDGPAVNPTGSPLFLVGLTGTAVAATGNILRITPGPIVFPDTEVGSMSAAQTFTLFNLSATTAATGVNFFSNAAFPITLPGGAGNCSAGMTLAASSSCNFTVRFAPPSAAAHAVSLVAASAAFPGGNGQTQISGNGLNPAAINTFSSTTPGTTITSLAYSGVATGTSTDLVFIVRNTSASPASSTAAPGAPLVTFTGAGAARYSSPSTTCTSALTANDGTNGSGTDECRVTIRYSPTAVGSNPATATVTFGTLTRNVSLTGNGVLNAVLGMNVTVAQTCTASPVAALTTAACGGGTWVNYTISNGGDVAMAGPLTIAFSNAVFSQGTTGGGNCVNGSTVLAAGASCTVRVNYSPDDLTADTTTLTVSAAVPGGTTSTVMNTINGNASSALTLTAGSGTFAGMTPVSGSANTTLTFTYATGASAPSQALRYAISGPSAADFDVVTDGCTGRTLAAGGTCQMTVRFRPSAPGATMAGTSLVLDDPRDYVRATVALSGTGM